MGKEEERFEAVQELLEYWYCFLFDQPDLSLQQKLKLGAQDWKGPPQ